MYLSNRNVKRINTNIHRQLTVLGDVILILWGRCCRGDICQWQSRESQNQYRIRGNRFHLGCYFTWNDGNLARCHLRQSWFLSELVLLGTNEVKPVNAEVCVWTRSWQRASIKTLQWAGYHYSVFECLSAQSVSASKGALKRCLWRVHYRQIFDPTTVTVLLGLAAFSKCELHFPLHTAAPDRDSSRKGVWGSPSRSWKDQRPVVFWDSSQKQCPWEWGLCVFSCV